MSQFRENLLTSTFLRHFLYLFWDRGAVTHYQNLRRNQLASILWGMIFKNIEWKQSIWKCELAAVRISPSPRPSHSMKILITRGRFSSANQSRHRS